MTTFAPSAGSPGVGRLRRVLFIRTDRLGETLLNLPAVAALNAAMPDASISLLVREELAPLFTGLPGVDEVLSCEELPSFWWLRAWRLSRRLKAHAFDAALVSNPKKELHLAVWLAGIPIRVGYDRKWGGLLTARLPDRKALGEHHEVEYNLTLVRSLGVPTTDPRVQWPRFEREHAEVQQLLVQQGIQPSDPFVAVHPWTSNPRKRWPADRYRALIRFIAQRLPVHVVVIGGPETQHETQHVLPPGVPAANLVGRLTLRHLAALLQRARLVVSNDSGPVHLAAAVGTQTLVLFGTSDPAIGPRRWGPWGPSHVVIWKPSIEEIAVDEVFAVLRTMVA